MLILIIDNYIEVFLIKQVFSGFIALYLLCVIFQRLQCLRSLDGFPVSRNVEVVQVEEEDEPLTMEDIEQMAQAEDGDEADDAGEEEEEEDEDDDEEGEKDDDDDSQNSEEPVD